MAGYLKLQRSIWRDSDFTRLSADAQRLYLLLISQPTISAVGVLPLTTGRWAALAHDTTQPDILTALEELQAWDYVIVDQPTEELWVRTYMVHDELYKVPNGLKALLSAVDQVLSTDIRTRVQTLIGTLTERVTERVTAPLQTANNRLQTSDSRQQTLPPAAIAALTLYIEHRVDQTQPRNPTGFRRTLQRQAALEHGPALTDYITQHPDANCHTLCTEVLGMTDWDIPN